MSRRTPTTLVCLILALHAAASVVSAAQKPPPEPPRLSFDEGRIGLFEAVRLNNLSFFLQFDNSLLQLSFNRNQRLLHLLAACRVMRGRENGCIIPCPLHFSRQVFDFCNLLNLVTEETYTSQ